MIDLLRALTAPIVLRFHDTDELVAALDLLKEGKVTMNDDRPVPEWLMRYMKRVMARELIRRNVFFWELDTVE